MFDQPTAPKPGSISPPPGGAPSAAPAKPLPGIRTMPEKFIGAEPGRAPVIREVVETRVVQPAAPRPVPPPPPPGGLMKKKKPWIIIIAGIVFLLGAAAAVFVLLLPPAAPVIVPVVNTPRNVNQNANVPLPPPAAICGNGRVETGEECDDGNIVSDDGCNASCAIEKIKPVPVPPRSGIDADSDGLTDIEETAIYGTSVTNIDSDGDTFNDGNEPTYIYDPMRKNYATLWDAMSFFAETNTVEKYKVLVPSVWSRRGEGTRQFFAAPATGEFFEVLVTDKPKEQSLVEWYLAQSPGSTTDEVERFKTRQGYDALRSPDRLTVYIDSGDGRMFSLVYSIDENATFDYRTTFEVFINSFTIVK